MASFAQRMIGAVKLEVATFSEVAADPQGLGHAMAVVLLSSLAGGLGAVPRLGWRPAILLVLGGLLGWAAWLVLTYLVGVKLWPDPTTNLGVPPLARAMGFATAPGIFRILGAIPWLGDMISLAATFWMLWATVVAIRHTLNYKVMGKAVGVSLLGFVGYLAVTYWVVVLGNV